MRPSRGMRLLEDTGLPIDEIARECGFFSATCFCRAFKRETGTTAVGYRSGIPRR